MDSNGRVHVVYTKLNTGTGIYDEVYRAQVDSPYTSVTAGAPAVLLSDPYSELTNLSISADTEGKVHVACLDSQNDISTAYYTGTSWSSTPQRGHPQLGLAVGRCSPGSQRHDRPALFAVDLGTDPDNVHYWNWGGSSWNATETNTAESTDDFVTAEKRSLQIAGDHGYLHFDGISATSGTLYFSRISFGSIQLDNHASGQVADQLAAVGAYNDATLFRFQLQNPTASAVTVDQVTLQLADVIGIVSGDLTDLRINDGTSDVSTGGSPSVSGDTGTITFAANFTVPANSTVNYVVLGDVAGVTPGDTLGLSLGVANVTLVSGTMGGWPATTIIHQAEMPLVYQVSASNDDAYAQAFGDQTTSPSRSSSVVSVRRYTSATSTLKLNGGFRFQGLAVPQGATILRAVFSGYVDSTLSDDLYTAVYGHKVAAAPDFATNLYIRTDAQRAKTTATASWQRADIGAGWHHKDVTAIVHEIVNQGDWVLREPPGAHAHLRRRSHRDCGSHVVRRQPALAAKLSIDYLPPYDIVLAQHGSGQLPDQFDGSTSRNDVPLFRFRLQNTSAGAITVSQLVLQLSGVSGIGAGDLSDLRIHDGTANVSAGGAASIPGATGTITFDADFAIPASTAVDYTVYGDAVALVNGDTLTIALGTGDITLASGTIGSSSPPSSPTHTADHAALLAAHASGQLADQLDGAPSKNDVGLFRFKLTNNGTTDVTVSQVALLLSSVAGIVSSDLTDLRVNDGSVDVSTAGAASIAGATGTITFDADFTLAAGATVNYTVIGDLTGLVNADTLTLALASANVTLAAGTVGGSAPSNATHTADHAATLGNHASGQVTDQLDTRPRRTTSRSAAFSSSTRPRRT